MFVKYAEQFQYILNINPRRNVCSFRYTNLSFKASISYNIYLNESTSWDLVYIAVLNKWMHSLPFFVFENKKKKSFKQNAWTITHSYKISTFLFFYALFCTQGEKFVLSAQYIMRENRCGFHNVFSFKIEENVRTF